MTRRQSITRRRFVQTTAVAGAALLGAPGFVSSRAPSEKLNIVSIGCGGQGGANLGQVLGERIRIGHRVRLSGPFGSAFHRPNHPGRVVLVASGPAAREAPNHQ